MKLTIMLAAAAALAACSDVTAPVSRHALSPTAASSADKRANVNKETIPFSVTACNDETVIGEAERHSVIHFVDTPSGRFMALVDTDDKITGTGAITGAAYSGKDKTKSQTNGGDQGANVFKLTSTLRLNGKGVPDTDISIVSMVVRNANGDVVVTKTSFETSCP
jgi:hypothetical protein